MKIKTNVINVNLKEVLYENRHLKKKQENAGYIFLLQSNKLPIRKSHLTNGNPQLSYFQT